MILNKPHILFVGAGFSHWSLKLPLANALFDFNISIDTQKEEKNIDKIINLKNEWDRKNPYSTTEEFIQYAIDIGKITSDIVVWYIGRRLTEPFIWYETHAGRTRRHTLMIDENRKFEIEGMLKAKNFITYLKTYLLDGIITTNYDLIIEYSLGTKNYNYGIQGEILNGRGAYPLSQWNNPVYLKGPLPLVKLHGSISWDSKHYYTDGRRGLTGGALIVPPIREKHSHPLLKHQWNTATELLKNTTNLIFFGFGFNQYDTAIIDLLKSSSNNIESILLIDTMPKLDYAKSIWQNVNISCLNPNNPNFI